MQNLLPTKKKKHETISSCFYNWCQSNWLKALSTIGRGTFRSTTHIKQACRMTRSLRSLWPPKRQPVSQSKPWNQMASKTKKPREKLRKKKAKIESVLLRRTQQNRKSRPIEKKAFRLRCHTLSVYLRRFEDFVDVTSRMLGKRLPKLRGWIKGHNRRKRSVGSFGWAMDEGTSHCSLGVQ